MLVYKELDSSFYGGLGEWRDTLENVEHCGGEPEQAANMHMNRLSFTLK